MGKIIKGGFYTAFIFLPKILIKIRFNFLAARPWTQACRNFTKHLVRRFFGTTLHIVTPQPGSRNCAVKVS